MGHKGPTLRPEQKPVPPPGRRAELDADPCQSCGSDPRVSPETGAELPVVKGALEAQAAAERRVAELEHEIDRATRRGDSHAETLRGIRSMGDDAERMRLWATDSLSGFTETLEATLLKLSDERNSLQEQLAAVTAERDTYLAEIDPPECRMQIGRDGYVPENSRDGMRLWKREADEIKGDLERVRLERDGWCEEVQEMHAKHTLGLAVERDRAEQIARALGLRADASFDLVLECAEEWRQLRLAMATGETGPNVRMEIMELADDVIAATTDLDADALALRLRSIAMTVLGDRSFRHLGILMHQVDMRSTQEPTPDEKAARVFPDVEVRVQSLPPRVTVHANSTMHAGIFAICGDDIRSATVFADDDNEVTCADCLVEIARGSIYIDGDKAVFASPVAAGRPGISTDLSEEVVAASADRDIGAIAERLRLITRGEVLP